MTAPETPPAVPDTPPIDARRNAQRSALVMAIFAAVCTTMMALTQWFTAPAIESSRQQERLRVLEALLPASGYNNAVVDDVFTLGSTPALGLRHGGRVYRARLDGAPAALILESVAPDGYAGAITLLVGVLPDGRLSGVRVTAHKETPGLGDYIDLRKDRRSPPWMSQFDQLSFTTLSAARWAPRREGGGFDDVTGATITARAVIRAAAGALEFAQTHAGALYAQPAGTQLNTADLTPSALPHRRP